MRKIASIALGLAMMNCGPSGRDRAGGGDDGGTDLVDGGGIASGDAAVQTFVYAHTASTLYKVDPETLALSSVGNFPGGVEITDIAINKFGVMIGISFTAVYRIDPTTAACTRLPGGLSGTFNGLSFVPASQIGLTGDDVLVATRNDDGLVFQIEPMTGAATQVGNMGAVVSSGDLVSVEGLGTLQTIDNGVGNDRLAMLAPNTFTAQMIGSDTGFADIWGVAFWKDKVFGFTQSGQFITIDPTTGVGTLVQGNGPAWWGAAVTTLAPTIL